MNKIKIIIIIFLTISIICSSILIFFKNSINNTTQETIEDNNDINNIILEVQNENNIIEEETPQIEELIITEEKLETYTTMYAIVGLNIREQPNKESNIIDVANINTELTTVDNSNENGWTKIKMNDNYYYVASKYLSNTKVEIKPKVTENTKKNTNTNNKNNTNTKNKNNTSTNNKNTGVLTKSKGVNYFNGHRETWYSQKVLPGKGLKIPGRHVDSRGLVCDCDGYICVASSDYPKGTIVETSLGTGKVYDSGCASGTIDIYTNW